MHTYMMALWDYAWKESKRETQATFQLVVVIKQDKWPQTTRTHMSEDLTWNTSGKLWGFNMHGTSQRLFKIVKLSHM